VAFHRQAKPLGRWDVNVVWVVLFRQQEGQMWVLAFQGEYNIHLYGKVLVFAHYHKLKHLVWNHHKVFPIFSFSSSHIHVEGYTNNVILPTFASDGYLLIGKTRGHGVNG
jgi:hypothetical protein